ncbi:MAG: hypothetical protein ACJ72A_01165 [Nocardioidaceae bacterium]|jgi:hypothetical protein
MKTDMPRWTFAAILLILVCGLVLVARGHEHHRGQYVGSQSSLTQLLG